MVATGQISTTEMVALGYVQNVSEKTCKGLLQVVRNGRTYTSGFLWVIQKRLTTILILWFSVMNNFKAFRKSRRPLGNRVVSYGIIGWRPRQALTFVDNHDTRFTQALIGHSRIRGLFHIHEIGKIPPVACYLMIHNFQANNQSQRPNRRPEAIALQRTILSY
nr:hypothetical protein [Tanacetum cinerariifolium]